MATRERMYAHAILGLNSLFIQGERGILRGTQGALDTRICWPSLSSGSTSFSCIGAREFDSMMCQEATQFSWIMRCPRGGLPGTLCDTHRAGEGQAPIMTWAAWSGLSAQL